MPPSDALRPPRTDTLAVAIVTGPHANLHLFYEGLGFEISGPAEVAGAARQRCTSADGSIKIDSLDPEPSGQAGGRGNPAGYHTLLLPAALAPPDGISTDPQGTRIELGPAGSGLGVVVGSREPELLAGWYEQAGLDRTGPREVAFGRSPIRFVAAAGEHPPPGRRSRGIRYLTLEVAEVDRAASALAAIGAAVVIEPMTMGRVRFAMLADPEGNWVEVGAAIRGAPAARSAR